ncbi:uncharacterized protein LOC126728512 [Quercus robur]|uniref:uncharacterized protein LOC126728512 n=1 Tax=Quercus robur TaxID=38942 RepID=UPI002162B372|nr:uncharacterized protein LOC126728512 [Quercus robur]
MVGTIQPHEDALVVTLRIGGYDVRRVMVDQGSAVDVMYPDLYKGLGLKPEDLTTYNFPLVSFEGRMVAPKGLIRLPVQAGTDVVEVDFIVIDVFSSYTAIVGRPWLHTLKAVSSTLHQKVGAKLPLHEKARLLEFLRANVDVFAWNPSADYTERIAKWGMILGAFDIKYMPRTSVKGQVFADLVAEFAECPEEVNVNQGHMDEKSVGLISTQDGSFWRVYVDGAANQRGAGLGLVLISPKEVIIEKSLRLGFSATNNESEYETLIMGMSMVQKMGGKAVKLFSDSRLVVGQLRGELEARDPRMQGYMDRVRRMQTKFESFDLLHIPRGENTHADSLATLATYSVRNFPRVIIVEDLCTPTSPEKEVCQINQTSLSPNWIDPILKFLESDILPKDKVEVDKIRRKAPRYWLSEDKKLYKRSFSGPYLLCVPPETAESILEELHEGICGSHTGGRSLSCRAITQRYWWPNMQKEAQEYVRKCDQCQRYGPSIHQPGGVLNPLSSPWPFAQWGLDIVGPFPKAIGNKKYLLVGTDYFTKWVEAEPLANIRDVDVKKFIWRNIVTRFGTPCTFVSDNGLQFDSNAFREYCSELGIRNRYSTPAYPQGNGQAEAVNKVIVNGLKKRLDDAKGKSSDHKLNGK